MITKRIIACLDVRDGRVVKGVQFVDIIDAGDPATQAARHAREGADEIVLTDIYPAGEPPIPGVDIPAVLRTFPPGAKASYGPRKQLADGLTARLRRGDLLLTLGAGDITQVAAEVLARLGR